MEAPGALDGRNRGKYWAASFYEGVDQVGYTQCITRRVQACRSSHLTRARRQLDIEAIHRAAAPLVGFLESFGDRKGGEAIGEAEVQGVSGRTGAHHYAKSEHDHSRELGARQ